MTEKRHAMSAEGARETSAETAPYGCDHLHQFVFGRQLSASRSGVTWRRSAPLLGGSPRFTGAGSSLGFIFKDFLLPSRFFFLSWFIRHFSFLRVFFCFVLARFWLPVCVFMVGLFTSVCFLLLQFRGFFASFFLSTLFSDFSSFLLPSSVILAFYVLHYCFSLLLFLLHTFPLLSCYILPLYILPLFLFLTVFSYSSYLSPISFLPMSEYGLSWISTL